VIIKGKFYYTEKCTAVKVQDNKNHISPHVSNCAMEKNPLSEAKSRCVSRDIFDDIQKPNVYHHTNYRAPIIHVLNLLNAVIPVAKEFSEAYIL
jgi:hypothetical protein